MRPKDDIADALEQYGFKNYDIDYVRQNIRIYTAKMSDDADLEIYREIEAKTEFNVIVLPENLLGGDADNGWNCKAPGELGKTE